MDRLLQTEHENERIVLGLLSSVENDGERSQRRIAAELGIALGLVNAYLKRCIKKGLVKVQDAPAHRYAYYLTPQGFAEKSRLTVQYLSHSFSFFRIAKSDCARVLEQAKASGFARVVLAGRSDLAEVATLCAVEAGVTIVAVVDPLNDATRFVGIQACKTYTDVTAPFDAVIVTDVARATATFEAAVAACGAERVLAPALLGLRPAQTAGRAMSDLSGKRWYVVQTQVNSELKAAQNLQRQGYDVYLPRYLKRRRHARKVDFTAKPLFPRYMFVAIDMAAQRWRSIQSTFGVSRLVCNGDDPASVPDGVVGALKAREDDKGFVKMALRPAFAPGDKVRVLAGAFMDNAGLFNGIADHDRVAILLEMLGRKVRVLLDADLIAAA